MEREKRLELIEYLREFVTAERWDTIERVLENRTRHLTVVLEDLYQPHNASAVLRSCDCFGIQDIHIIENENRFTPNKGITIGADQWLSVKKYQGEGDNTMACFEELRSRGYRIIATTPHAGEVSMEQLPVEPRTALVFGTEMEGLSERAMEEADGHVSIPLYGFSESYNISVSVALCLYELTHRLRESGTDWRLRDLEKESLQLEWLENSIRAAEQLKRKFLEN